MRRLKSKQELATDAMTLAQSFKLVWYRNNLYVPTHYTTGEVNAFGTPEDTLWKTMSQADLRRLAGAQFSTLFASDSELRNFHFMVMQSAQFIEETVDALMVRTSVGLRVLTESGQLVEPDGSFIANTLLPQLVEDEARKKEVFDTIANWLNSEEEAHSLLYHLATVLAPGWSAVKYVLLLGEGRNGKGVLLGMLSRLFGKENMSAVPRQEMAKRSPMVIDLNGKLINVISDGSVEYIKDSGTEKTVVAGEPAAIKDLYVSAPVTVQTNALFVEALNTEPLSRDKSPALQKRLARFHFDNIYELDKTFESHMWSEEMVGAFLSLLIDHYVRRSEAAEKLALTAASKELQLDHMLHNSHGLQYMKTLFDEGNLDVIGEQLEAVAKGFIIWRGVVGDKSSWDLAEAVALLGPVFEVERKSKRINGSVRKVKVITAFKSDAQRFIESLEVIEDEDSFNAMVDD